MASPEWLDRANCHGLPDMAFFPPDVHDTEEEQAASDAEWYAGWSGQEALRVCRSCSVRAECFEYALEDPYTIENGVFGGTTPSDRDRYLSALQERNRRSD